MNEMITPELALSAAKVLHDYCDSLHHCSDCELLEHFDCELSPCQWNIPEKRLQRKGVEK